MTIAYEQNMAIGARTFNPQGPFDSINSFPAIRPGMQSFGDAGLRVIACTLYVYTPLTVSQGDVFLYDDSFTCYPISTAAALQGMAVGTAFFGGLPKTFTQGPGSQAQWQYLLVPGNYIIWLQIQGCSVINQITTAVANFTVQTTSTPLGAVDGKQTATAGSKNINNMFIAATSGTFTGTTVQGTPNITATTSLLGVSVGMKITGAGIPANCFILAVNGAVVTLGNNVSGGSALATASASVTVTWANNSFTANTVTATNTLTNISNLAGIYPNATLTGAGLLAGTTIVSIVGTGQAVGSSPSVSGPVIVLNQNVTATATSVTITPSIYLEGYLNHPVIGSTN